MNFIVTYRGLVKVSKEKDGKEGYKKKWTLQKPIIYLLLPVSREMKRIFEVQGITSFVTR